MKSGRLFLLIVIVGYALLTAAGIWLLQGPEYTSAYLDVNQQDHQRYLKIKTNPLYQLHSERPHLHPLEGTLKVEAEFAKEYTARPEFRSEQKRMLLYALWFKVLNAGFIFLVLFYFGTPYLLKFLDSQIEDISNTKLTLERDLANSIDEASAARRAYDKLPEKAAELQAAHDQLLQEKLASIEEQTENALKQIALDAEKRIAAEEKAATATIRRELVTSALHELELRYRKAADLEHLKKDVESFSQFMGFLS
ncbi:MAG: hypothetical protein GX130_11830 [Candidatus Hydrogenedens sp.]|jgi:F0F1-type ATP synthase membrane subunit b/b'|nr:hypothetical protein [Candidatus Hydrogenedens sp.]